jgi:hypothetical protein
MAIELVTLLPEPAHERLLEAFHRGIYLDAFAAQREPLEAWLRALRGERPYRQTIRLALAGDRLDGAAPLPPELDGAIPRGFVEELYAAIEGGPPDAEVAFPDRVALVELRRPDA